MRIRLFASSLLLVMFIASFTTAPAYAASPQIETFHSQGSFEIGPCPSGVTLVETFTEDDRLITFFDSAGNPVAAQFHFNYEGVVTNPATGQILKDPAHGVRFFDFVEGTRGPVGLYFSTIVPGVGVVFHDVGRLVRDLNTGNIIFEAGPHDVAHGDYVALWCAAFGA